MPIWLQILLGIVGGIGTIFGIVGVFFIAYASERGKHKAQKKNDAEDKKEAEEAAKQQKLEELEQNKIMDGLVEQLAERLLEKIKPVISKMLDDKVKPFNEAVKEIREDLGYVKSGVQDTCRNDLEDLVDKADSQGFLSKYDKDRFEHMYNGSYHHLGPNGVMKGAYERIMTMPERPPRKRSNRSNKK